VDTTLQTYCCENKNIISHNSGLNQSKELDEINIQLSDDELSLLEQLSQFELGKFLLANKGLNGYWTSYIINLGKDVKNHHPLEHLRENIVVASIPCGLMDDLLTLNYGAFDNIRLVGIDLDKNSLELAYLQSKKLDLKNKVQFMRSDAWQLNNIDEFDIITSNGLNIYEPDDEKVISLYSEFYKALKNNGLLITSFLTPPPTLSEESSWRNYNQKDLLKQKVIFNNVIGVKWQCFNTEHQVISQFEKAGFKVEDVIYDSQGMFPTIVARKI
jgi:SAM-dependent methyltransferase